MVEWHASFDRMRQKQHVLLCCPQAVGEQWGRVVDRARAGDFKPWGHQEAAATWSRERMHWLFAASMGTGKSLMALLSLGLLGADIHPVILTAGTGKKRAEVLQKALATAGTKTLVVICNYDAVWRGELAAAVQGVKWKAIVLDESHRIKSPAGKQSRWLFNLAKKQPLAKRVLLTGTPMPHSPLDIWAQYRFLDVNVFGPSFTKFRARYADCDRMFPSKVKKWINQEELTRKIDEHAWRVTADEVLTLPEAIHESLPVTLSAATMRYYRDIEREMVAAIGDGTVTCDNGLVKLLRLQEATSGRARLDDSPGTTPIDGTPAKRMVLQEWLEDLPATEPVVVFAKFRGDLDDIAAVARELGRGYSEVSGREKSLAAWQAGDTAILGVQIQSGGTGLDLFKACYCAYYSLGFSLGEYEQSLARLHRPGQTRCVRYYHLVAKGTVDEAVYAALRERRNVVEAVLSRLSPRKEVMA